MSESDRTCDRGNERRPRSNPTGRVKRRPHDLPIRRPSPTDRCADSTWGQVPRSRARCANLCRRDRLGQPPIELGQIRHTACLWRSRQSTNRGNETHWDKSANHFYQRYELGLRRNARHPSTSAPIVRRTADRATSDRLDDRLLPDDCLRRIGSHRRPLAASQPDQTKVGESVRVDRRADSVGSLLVLAAQG